MHVDVRLDGMVEQLDRPIPPNSRPVVLSGGYRANLTLNFVELRAQRLPPKGAQDGHANVLGLVRCACMS